MSIGTELNNPFDLRPDPRWTWRGEIAHESGFIKFDTLEDGLRAGLLNLKNTVGAGFDTPRKLVWHYAPPEENDSAGYLAGLCMSTGWHDATPLSSVHTDPVMLIALGKAILIEEQGTPYVSTLASDVLLRAANAALAA